MFIKHIDVLTLDLNPAGLFGSRPPSVDPS